MGHTSGEKRVDRLLVVQHRPWIEKADAKREVVKADDESQKRIDLVAQA